MSRKNAVKVTTDSSSASGYFFRSSCNTASFVLTAKHGVCNQSDDCQTYNESEYDACRVCKNAMTVEGLILNIGCRNLTPEDVYIYDGKDIAIIKVQEKSDTTLKISGNSNSGWRIYSYEADSQECGRILLNEPENSNGYIYYNISSDPNPELVEKSKSYYGVSGSLVHSLGNESQVQVASSVICNNEKFNELSGESLLDINMEKINDYFKCKVFLSSKLEHFSVSKIIDKFNVIDKFSLNDNLTINTLVPKDKGYPFYSYNSIIEYLIPNIQNIVGSKTHAMHELQLASAIKAISTKKKYRPVKKILTSKMVESVLIAPHIYSTPLDSHRFYNLHIKHNNDDTSLIYSNFGGEKSLEETLDAALIELANNVNSYDCSLVEKSALNKDMKIEQCEALYDALFSPSKQEVKSIAILFTFVPDQDKKKYYQNSDELVAKIVRDAVSKIDECLVSHLSSGVNVYLYVLPTNRENEISDLLEEFFDV